MAPLPANGQGPRKLNSAAASQAPRRPRLHTLTCGREQQRAVLAVQVLHSGDASVAGVPVVEVVQLLPFLPVPETPGGKSNSDETRDPPHTPG